MIIGPGCSTGALPIAEISPFWNLTQVTNLLHYRDHCSNLLHYRDHCSNLLHYRDHCSNLLSIHNGKKSYILFYTVGWFPDFNCKETWERGITVCLHFLLSIFLFLISSHPPFSHLHFFFFFLLIPFSPFPPPSFSDPLSFLSLSF